MAASPDAQELAQLCDGHPYDALSTRDAAAVAELEAKLIAAVRRAEEELTAFVPYTAVDMLSLIYANCRVERSDAGDAGLASVVQEVQKVFEPFCGCGVFAAVVEAPFDEFGGLLEAGHVSFRRSRSRLREVCGWIP